MEQYVSSEGEFIHLWGLDCRFLLLPVAGLSLPSTVPLVRQFAPDGLIVQFHANVNGFFHLDGAARDDFIFFPIQPRSPDGFN